MIFSMPNKSAEFCRFDIPETLLASLNGKIIYNARLVQLNHKYIIVVVAFVLQATLMIDQQIIPWSFYVVN